METALAQKASLAAHGRYGEAVQHLARTDAELVVQSSSALWRSRESYRQKISRLRNTRLEDLEFWSTTDVPPVALP